jgi:hypothetical protein
MEATGLMNRSEVFTPAQVKDGTSWKVIWQTSSNRYASWAEATEKVFDKKKRGNSQKNVRDFGIAQRKFILDAMVCSWVQKQLWQFLFILKSTLGETSTITVAHTLKLFFTYFWLSLSLSVSAEDQGMDISSNSKGLNIIK